MCHEHLSEDQRTEVALFRIEQQQEFIEKNDGDIQKGKAEYAEYLMAIPGSVTFQKSRLNDSDEEDEGDLATARETNSVMHSMQVEPTQVQNSQPTVPPKISQTFSSYLPASTTQAASVEDSDSVSSDSSDSDSDEEDTAKVVLGKRTHQAAFAPVTPSKQDISKLWNK